VWSALGMNFKDSSRRLRVAGLVSLVAAGLVAATAVGAQAPSGGATVFTHSAGSGELRGGRLILHGVRGRVTWANSSGRSEVVAVRRLHRRMFRRATPAATGTLHVAGHHGGDEPTFRLSKPRYNRARRTVSYRTKPLDRSAFVGAAGAARRFGAASLSIKGAPQAIGGDVLVCETTLTNNTPETLLFTKTSTEGAWTLKPPKWVTPSDSASWSATQAQAGGCTTKVRLSTPHGEVIIDTGSGRDACLVPSGVVVCQQLPPPQNDPNGVYWSLWAP
jgi:hypothetical protein